MTDRFTARFEQPRGHLNPMGLKIPDPVEIEVYATGKTLNRWKARYLGGKDLKMAAGADVMGHTAGMVQAQVAQLFERRITEWEGHERPEIERRQQRRAGAQP